VLYLQKKLSPGRFDSLIGRLKRWVFKHAASGPLIYGQRIANLEGSYEAFQGVVYLKSALVLLMLHDMLGEENFFKRLRGCLEKFKYKSVTSAMLIDEISRDEGWLHDFFQGWVFSRKIPEVSCRVRLAGNTAELSVSQKETAFVFPLQIHIETEQGKKTLQVIVKEKEQTFTFNDAAAFKSLKIDPGYAPILVSD
jgi:aminopeptidase N